MIYYICKEIERFFLPLLVQKLTEEKRTVIVRGSFFVEKSMLGKGRNVIFTSYKEITAENVIGVVTDAMQLYRQNADECQYLLDYASGDQPIQRKEEKKYMDWVDCRAVDNVALEICDFWRGFGWGNPITLVQRGDVKDPDTKASGIAELNYCYSATGNERDLQAMADFIVKCGHAFTLIDINTEYEEGDSYFTRDVVDPRWAFVVRSKAYSDNRVVLGVTLNIDKEDYYFTAYTKDRIFNIKAIKSDKSDVKQVGKDADYFHKHYMWEAMDLFDEKNVLGRIPLIEWYWESSRTGVFENQISALDNINLLVSDISNGIEQNIQAFWWTNNVEFEKIVVKDSEGNDVEVIKKPQNGDFIHTRTTRDGVNPSIQPLVMDYNLDGMNRTYIEQRALVLQKCHVPQRSETSGGSSGVAMDAAAGWADAESVASSREEIVKGCQLDEIKVVLKAVKECPEISSDNPMLLLYANDIQPAIRRPRNSDLASKTNSITTLLAHGFALEDCVANVPLFADATQVIQRSGEGVKKYQETIFNQANDAEAAPNADRTMQDSSDNASKSPMLNQ